MNRTSLAVTIVLSFLILLPIGLVGIVSGQNQTVSIAILNFQDDTGANAPAELGQKLAQDLHQKVATGYKDLLPRLVVGSDAAAVKGLTIDQIAALGKQNGAKFVVRGGLLTLTSELAGSDSKVTVQLYADIISADTSALVTTVRAEGSATQSGAAPQLSALDVKNDQFPASGVGQALTSAIAQLADSVHQAISGTGTGPTTSDTGQVATQTQPDTAQPTTQTDAAKTAEADTDLQQLITQAESLLSSSANPSGQSATAASQDLQALKAALESKATLMQSGQNTSQADQEIATQRQALQTAVAQMTTEAAAASSSGTVSTNTEQQQGTPKKNFLDKINDSAGKALGFLQQIQQIRTTLQSLKESSASTNQTTTGGSTSTTGQTNSGNTGATEQQLGEVNGVVTDQNGTPIPSAQVAEQTSGTSSSTDNNGQYDLKGLLANQIATLVVTAGGKTMSAQTPITSGQTATVDFQLKPDTGSGIHPIVLPPTVIVNSPAGAKIGALKGVVRDAQGRPVARALVTLRGLGIARTNSQGEYQFLNVPVGAQQLTVNQSGQQAKTAQVQVSAAKSTDAPVQFGAGDRIAGLTRSSLLSSVSGMTLRGSVLDTGNNPIAGAKIAVIQQTSAVAVFTGANGGFELKNVKPGAFRVIASKAGFYSSVQDVTLGSGPSNSVEFRLKQQNSPLVASLLKRDLNRQATIRGRVLAANGNPVVNATVMLKAVAGAPLTTVKTNQTGEYQFTVGAGQYEVRVSRDSFQAASRVVEAKAGALTQNDFALKPAVLDSGRIQGNQTSTTTVTRPVKPGTLVGQVLDAKTGRPVTGAIVSISGSQRTPTNQTGNFAFANLSPGNYQVTITKTGYSTVQRMVSIRSGETTQTSFALATPAGPMGIRRP